MITFQNPARVSNTGVPKTPFISSVEQYLFNLSSINFLI
nr:MAG TPA: hypothetical protein [Caudoviricetes sp.]